MAFEVISARQIKEMVGNPDYYIVDLRQPDEYQRGHVKGAVNITFDAIEHGNCFFSKNKTIVFYCDRGATSFLAAKFLHDKGYKTCTVVGGYVAIKK